MKLPVEGIGIGFLGRLVPEKGPLLFLEALNIGASEFLTNGAWCAIAGRGPLENEVRRLSEIDHRHYLGVLRHPGEVADFFRSIDVFVAPSWRTDESEEQSPRSIIEAMLSSCAVVGARTGAVPEMIEGVGVLVAEKDPSDLARGIAEAVEKNLTPDQRQRIRGRALDRYSGRAVAAGLVEFWNRALHFRGN